MHGTDQITLEVPATAVQLVKQFWDAPPQALFKQPVIAQVLVRSEASLERWRLVGNGPPFIKTGRAVVYRKADVLSWLSQFEPVHSTSEYREEV